MLLVIGWCCGGYARADVYASYQDERVPRFASQPLDATYRLIIREAPPADSTGAQAGPSFFKGRAAIDPIIERIALRHSVDAALVRAVVEVESRFNVHAVSAKGAVGPMQLMPQTARRYGAGDRMNPLQNVEAGVAYLKSLLARFEGNTALALAAYNAGEHAVIRSRKVIPRYRETMLYVPRVLAAYAQYREERAGSGN
jgi:soluble lytic murein transglycosylase-like protein